MIFYSVQLFQNIYKLENASIKIGEIMLPTSNFHGKKYKGIGELFTRKNNKLIKLACAEADITFY